MKTLTIAAAGPRIKSASRWRSCALFLSGLSLILGLAATAYAKKPVKPPPEPPPTIDTGIIYAAHGKYWIDREVTQVELLSTGTRITELFPMVLISWDPVDARDEGLLRESLMPSDADHNGRWFVGAETPIWWDGGEAQYPYYLSYPDSWVYPNLVAINETGVSVQLLPSRSFQVCERIAPQWFDNDSKIAFVGRKFLVPPPLPADPPYELVTLVEGTDGIYVANIDWVNDVPVLVGEPQLVPWTSGLWNITPIDAPTIMGFSLSSDHLTIYYDTWHVDSQDQTGDNSRYSLYEADFVSGVGRSVPVGSFRGSAVNPTDTALLGSGEDPESIHAAISVLPLGIGEPNTFEPGAIYPIWSPTGQSICYVRRIRNFRSNLMSVSPDGSNVSLIDGGYWREILAWRSAP